MTKELLNESPVTLDAIMQAIALAILATLLGILAYLVGLYHFQYSDPYIRNVLALDADIEHGQAIFQMNCASCHGIYGDGLVGPSLHHVADRKSEVALIRQVTSGQTPPMPQFQPEPQTMADLLGYMKTL
ncbi:MAG: cytochrome c [Leptolyngbyaceae bacterium]|nr:cytochrome c [Leptolyngbyaceae bacterium]